MRSTVPSDFLVFISHATKDQALASRIAKVLDSLYLRAFVYENYRIAGQQRFQVIRDRIRECPYFVVLLTQNGKRSQWVNQEIGFAAALNNKVLIPIVLTKRRRRIQYYGFIELSDPIDLDLTDPAQAIGELIFSLHHWSSNNGQWRDQVMLRCVCGWSGPMKLTYRRQKLWMWDCPKCQRKIEVSPVTYEPLQQMP